MGGYIPETVFLLFAIAKTPASAEGAFYLSLSSNFNGPLTISRLKVFPSCTRDGEAARTCGRAGNRIRLPPEALHHRFTSGVLGIRLLFLLRPMLSMLRPYRACMVRCNRRLVGHLEYHASRNG